MVNENISRPVKKNKTSIILAIYNLSDDVLLLCNAIVKTMEDRDFEIVFIDDGSTDNTYEKLIYIAKQDNRIRAVKMRATFGEGTALRVGLQHSEGEKIVFLCGRVRVDAEKIPDFLKSLDQEKDFIVGWRSPRSDSLLNRFVSWIFNRMVNLMSDMRLHDINSGMFATRRSVLENISFYGELYNFIPLLVVQQGYHVGEQKIEQLPGAFRNSKNPKAYLRRFLDIVTVFFLTRYSKKPIHFLGFVGMLFFLTGLGIEIYLFVYRILQYGAIAGRPLLLLGAILLVIGIQMISIGLLGEMIIFTHAGDIEEYNIEEIINP